MVCLMVQFMSRSAAEDTPRPSIIKSFQYVNLNFLCIIDGLYIQDAINICDVLKG